MSAWHWPVTLLMNWPTWDAEIICVLSLCCYVCVTPGPNSCLLRFVFLVGFHLRHYNIYFEFWRLVVISWFKQINKLIEGKMGLKRSRMFLKEHVQPLIALEKLRGCNEGQQAIRTWRLGWELFWQLWSSQWEWELFSLVFPAKPGSGTLRVVVQILNVCSDEASPSDGEPEAG